MAAPTRTPRARRLAATTEYSYTTTTGGVIRTGTRCLAYNREPSGVYHPVLQYPVLQYSTDARTTRTLSSPQSLHSWPKSLRIRNYLSPHPHPQPATPTSTTITTLTLFSPSPHPKPGRAIALLDLIADPRPLIGRTPAPFPVSLSSCQSASPWQNQPTQPTDRPTDHSPPSDQTAQSTAQHLHHHHHHHLPPPHGPMLQSPLDTPNTIHTHGQGQWLIA